MTYNLNLWMTVAARLRWLPAVFMLALPLAAEPVAAGPLRFLFGGGENYQRSWDDPGSRQTAPYASPYGPGTGVESGIDRGSPTLGARKNTSRKFPTLMSGGPRPQIAPAAPGIVAFPNKEIAGTVIIVNRACRLYYTLSPTEALEYPISIGRQGFTWTGTEKISRIVDWPDWIPPTEMLQRQPELPRKMTGGLNNPLGARALYLGESLYRIHGTNDEKTIGRAASSGCFRMMNEHVMHLSGLVRIGTTVKVVKNWPLTGVVGGPQSAGLMCGPEIAAGPRRNQPVARETRERDSWQRGIWTR